MEIAFTVKNMSRGLKPKEDDVLVFDGKIWYITTKQNLFREYDEHFDEKIEECNAKIREMNELKAELARQMLEYGQLIREVITKGE